MDIRFACPECDQPARLALNQPVDWQCPACDHRLHIAAVDSGLSHCAVCGVPELYKKKDFPHTIGMAILIVACVVSVLTYGYYEKWLTWAVLLGSAAVDGLLYLLVSDAIVCYRCQTHYKGFPATDTHPPYELAIGERYRQEQIRREQLRSRPNSHSS